MNNSDAQLLLSHYSLMPSDELAAAQAEIVDRIYRRDGNLTTLHRELTLIRIARATQRLNAVETEPVGEETA